MSESSLAFDFEEECLQNVTRVKVYLTNGICLEGTIEDHDEESMTLLDSSKQRLLVFKNAISTIKPNSNNVKGK